MFDSFGTRSDWNDNTDIRIGNTNVVLKGSTPITVLRKGIFRTKILDIKLYQIHDGDRVWDPVDREWTPEVKVPVFADKIKFRSEGFGPVSSFVIGFLGTMLLGRAFENKGK